MTSSFTREPLRPLLDRKVYVEGRVAKWRRNDDGTNSLLITTVTVRPYDPAVPVLAPDPTRVDHLWLHGIAPERMSRIQLLGHMAGLGTVHLYARGDQSVDIGARFMPSVDFSVALEKYKRWAADKNLTETVSAAAHLLEQARLCLADGTGFVRGREIAMPRVVRDLERLHQNLERDLHAEFKAAWGSAIHGGISRRERRALERKKGKAVPAQFTTLLACK